MWLHHLTDSREAAERLNLGLRRIRGLGTEAEERGEFPTTVLRSDGQIVIRMEIPGVDLDDVRVEDGVVVIKLGSGERLERRAGSL
jgi:HSP20 family molecular chaperone IbpA